MSESDRGYATWQDIMEIPEWNEHAANNEAAFRRGYFSAIGDIIDAMRSGTLARQILAYYNNDLWEWRFGSTNELIEPPDMPMPWVKISKSILDRDNYVCHYCGGIADTVDHKKPVARGGSDSEDNLVAACRRCNSKKHTTPYKDFVNGTDV